jgi:hypothetical protein
LYQPRTSNESQPPERRIEHADFCPKCWVDFPDGVSACSERGRNFPSFLREKDCAGKNIISLNHLAGIFISWEDTIEGVAGTAQKFLSPILGSAARCVAGWDWPVFRERLRLRTEAIR